MRRWKFPDAHREKCEKSFWNRTIPEPMSGCILWSGAQRPNGYGKFSYEGKHWIAHRLAWFFTYGRLSDDICVLHKCDNPLCVNTNHLFLGSKAENNKDRTKKGRTRVGHVHGEAHGRHKLTEAEVLRIRNETGIQKKIAQKYGVSHALIYLIKRHKKWRHLDGSTNSNNKS